MKLEDFLKLSKAEQDVLILKMADVQDACKKIADQEVGMSQLTMPEFEEKMKGIMEKLIKGMTPVDRKHFMFPGIGDNAKMADDLSPEGKYAKTKKFFNALIGKNTQVLNQMHMDVATKANLSEGTTTAGGFLVPEEFKAEIQRLQPLYGVIRQNVRILPMAYDIVNIPVADREVTASWVNEAATIASTDPTFRQATLAINKLASIPQVTNELLADASVSVIDFLAMTIAEQFAKAEDQQGFNGTGSPFVGALFATGVPQGSHAGGAVALSYGDISRFTGQLYANALGNAKFYLHRSMIARVQGLITTAGAPIFGQTTNSLFGYPLVNTEILPSDGTVTGTNYGLFGDLRRGMIMGERGSMTMKITEEGTVGGNNLFEKDMAALRVIERVALGVVLPSSFLTIKG
jgi:HK97 family phage major capsid protein